MWAELSSPVFHFLSNRTPKKNTLLSEGEKLLLQIRSIHSNFQLNQQPSIFVTTWNYHLVLKYWHQMHSNKQHEEVNVEGFIICFK